MAIEETAQPVADALLVESARIGSITAFEALVERYDTPLRSFLYHLTGDAELAADLAQETFLDAYRCRKTLPTDRPFAAWLYRTARYNALPVRRRQRLYRIVSLDWLTLHLKSGILGLHCPDDVRSVHNRDLIQRVLDQLSPNLREALLLSAISGFTGQEVATILDISPEAARKRISRAATAFRRIHRDCSDKDVVPDDV